MRNCIQSRKGIKLKAVSPQQQEVGQTKREIWMNVNTKNTCTRSIATSIIHNMNTRTRLETSNVSSISSGISTRNIHHDNDYNSGGSSKRETKIQILGDKNSYDAVKKLRLIELPNEYHPQPNLIASMHVKRNLIFGTRVHDREYLKSKKKVSRENTSGERNSDVNDDDNNQFDYDNDENNYHNLGFVKVCKPLLKKGLEMAGVEGDQPQGLAALHGLSARVRYLLDKSNKDSTESKAMEKLRHEYENDDGNNDQNIDKKIIFEAITSIATQIPRPGHDMVGMGTYFDAREGWTTLAKEYALSRKGEMIVQGESQLFQTYGAVLVGIEYIGEENPDYWIDSGGAMARFFFI